MKNDEKNLNPYVAKVKNLNNFHFFKPNRWYI